jgi:hypothetical protein
LQGGLIGLHDVGTIQVCSRKPTMDQKLFRPGESATANPVNARKSPTLIAAEAKDP